MFLLLLQCWHPKENIANCPNRQIGEYQRLGNKTLFLIHQLFYVRDPEPGNLPHNESGPQLLFPGGSFLTEEEKSEGGGVPASSQE